MPQANSLYQYLGGASFPLSTSDVSTGAFPDAVRDTLLALFAAAVNYEFGNAASTPWRTVRTGTSLSAADPVADTWPGLPTEQLLLERKTGFPCLFLGRTGEGEFTGSGSSMERDATTWKWDLTWCLGPLTTGEAHRFEAALKLWFPALVRLVSEARAHRAYTPLGLNGDGLRPNGTAFKAGQIPFGPGGIPLGELEALNFDAAAIPVGEKKTLYHGCTVNLRTIEYAGFVEGASVPLQGSKATIDVGGFEGLVTDFIEIDTAHPRSG